MKKTVMALLGAVSLVVSVGNLSAQEVGANSYALFRLTTDMGQLSETERQMIPHLIEAAKLMDEIFWMQTFSGHRDELLDGASSEAERDYLVINYGPWDRLSGNAAFLSGVGEKPMGSNFYPADMTSEEFETAAADNPDLASLYTLVRRAEDGSLQAVPYREAFAEQVTAASRHIRMAAALAEDPGLRTYLELRAEAMLTDDYQPSDIAWMQMKNNRIDFVVGPIETYEDQLFGYKASYEAYVLIKDVEWSGRLARYAELLPALQMALPVPEEYRQETPGRDSELNAYEVIYYAGEANAGAKTIAINLPNDEEVQLQQGTRRLQLKNAMQAKFDLILEPISGLLIAEDQRQHITFDAFFANTMFHEVAHGLGIKNTLDGSGTVRQALQNHASALEEGKADVLGLFMIAQLYENGEIEQGDLRDNYVTFLASIFRSVRFGASSAHGRANMIRFNFFQDFGAFSRDDETGTYSVDFERFAEAVNELSRRILILQGDGDYDGVSQMVEELGVIRPGLQDDLDRLTSEGIPVDIIFEQGMSVLEPAS